MRILYTKS